jgi:hypothetical protein
LVKVNRRPMLPIAPFICGCASLSCETRHLAGAAAVEVAGSADAGEAVAEGLVAPALRRA